MPKEGTNDNSAAVVSVVLGILSIVLASLVGLILGITGLIFAIKQEKYMKNKWTRVGKILNIAGIVVSVIVIVVTAIIALNSSNIQQLLSQYG